MLTITNVIITLFHLLGETTDLANAAHKYAPQDLTIEAAFTHAVAAKMVETPNVPAELLLSLAFVESRYQPSATSRMEHGVRKVGIPKWKYPNRSTSGPYFCGVTQVMADMSWKKCLEFRDIFLAYKTTVDELEIWLKSSYCQSSNKPMQCALWGYGGGHPAIKARASTYPARVLGRALAITKAVYKS